MTAIETLFFTGVNAGYAQDATITDHAQALDMADKGLAFVKRSGGGDRNSYRTHPALVVYDPALECPVGGEIAVAVNTASPLSGVVKTAEKLRAHLEQSSLSVSGAPEPGHATTHGLRIETTGDLQAVAKAWQDTATRVKDATVTADNPYGTYVSVGVYEAEDGAIVIQGEANPRYFTTPQQQAAWKEAAVKVAEAMELDPQFREVGFDYLRAKDRVNSRGESD